MDDIYRQIVPLFTTIQMRSGFFKEGIDRIDLHGDDDEYLLIRFTSFMTRMIYFIQIANTQSHDAGCDLLVETGGKCKLVCMY
jgi:hypothetical protein